MTLKLCQGSRCHTYITKDRLKGIQGSKTYQTRRRSRLLFDEFCSMHCQHDWLAQHVTQAIDHFGRLTEPKHLTEQNAWTKEYDYNWRNEGNERSNFRSVNKITQEQRPLTREQYNDTSYTLNER